MAKKSPKESQQIASVPIKWLGSPAPSIFANQMIVQADANDFYLSFFEITPPLVIGENESEQKKQIEAMGGVEARLVARLVINAQRMETFAGAIMQTVIKHKEKHPQQDTDKKEG